ncbi:MAG TPA: PQQ-dependent sugar dehydrogenase [Caldimonas sp.]|jgi:glucose/arabinose dehydrogenase|nr:PQQ-dependent sugar dehydrogenase [Caldimonas sp.]HEX4233586.1 PQQ-dependent sugar dehydrogenase [Caldimonas sp.]
MNALRRKWPSASAVLVLLAACGGGGGSDPGPVGAKAPDIVAPTATLTAPAPLASGLTGVIAISATASDDVAVTAVEFQVDGVAIGSVAISAPYATTLDTSAYPSGQHVVRARASDAAGNVSAWSSATVSFGGAVMQPAGFTRNQSWVTGLANATAFAQAPDGRLFVAEQGGTLRVVKNGALLATPFVSIAVDSAGERGLIGVALSPNFATNGFIYVYSTRTTGGAHNRISRFIANGDVAAAGSETTLVDLPNLSTATNHNGGGMHFGNDGKLYVGVGENANPPQSQDLSVPFGKLLRFNEDGSIPADNPFFATAAGVARAIWAYGLRNPYTFAIEPGTGTIFINDVGQDTWEEIDVGVAGANYGWPNSEGPDNVGAGITGPLFTYKHSAANPPGSGPGGFFIGFAIAGGAFYPAAGPFPAGYRGHYYFADYVNQFVGRLDVANGAAYAFASLSGAPVDLLVGSDGALYVLTRGNVTRISSP